MFQNAGAVIGKGGDVIKRLREQVSKSIQIYCEMF